MKTNFVYKSKNRTGIPFFGFLKAKKNLFSNHKIFILVIVAKFFIEVNYMFEEEEWEWEDEEEDEEDYAWD